MQGTEVLEIKCCSKGVFEACGRSAGKVEEAAGNGGSLTPWGREEGAEARARLQLNGARGSQGSREGTCSARFLR